MKDFFSKAADYWVAFYHWCDDHPKTVAITIIVLAGAWVVAAVR